ncbi:helix-turn-helix domain-containing protein [Pedobacter psychroterrae]|uniref:AraC family transcriptional regulator n=1 Tax=Pedobacter psychroterrae TaxID=2530453 RepID=A0A4R0NQD1_9SPHI|nr:AraC family transcriptional regulator [Pedobacter psychroterrae]TCD01284.1 AraC family transcriptional regulator [Pedobacter psychroterrae]
MKEEKLRIFNDLHEQYKHLGLPVSLIDRQSDFTIFNLADIRDMITIRPPISRLNFFVFAFVKNGQGNYTIDEQRFDIRPSTVYFTNPGHSRSFDWAEVGEVYLITLSESFLKENVHADIFEEFPFLLAETFPARVLAPEVFEEFERLYLQIHKEYLSHSPFRNRLIGNLFVVLLLKIKEYFWLDYNPIYEGNRSSHIVKNFKRLLEKHYRDLSGGMLDRAFRVQEYADDQNLHPNYLSSVIKAKTGKAIGTWIAEKTIAEAKSLLQNSSISIKEISFRLGFSESAHFSNYFKKHTKISPASFRSEHILKLSKG